MAKSRNDSYHEIENRLAGKHLLRKEMSWTMLFVYSILALMILYSFTYKGYDIVGEMFLSQPTQAMMTSKKIDYKSFFYASTVIFVLLFLLLYPSSYTQKVRQMQIKLSKKGSLSDIDHAVLKIWEYIDKLLYFIFFPLSVLFLSGIPVRDRNRIYFRMGWLNHLEKNFFKQEFVKTDGYKRPKEMILLNRYPEYFTKEKGEKAKTSNEFAFTRWLFKSNKEFHDLMLIAEGFIISAPPKYDSILNAKSYRDKMKSLNGDIDKFRLYNGKDEVLFSHDLIKDLIDDESDKFESFIRKYAFSSRMLFSRRFAKYSFALKKDVNIRKYLFPATKKAEIVDEVLNDPEKFKNHLVFALVCYFRFVMFKMIIGQYVNFPAGVIVVKQRDYTIRMITEIFDDRTLINIVDNKNDGSTGSFESDNLTNLFLTALNHYRVGAEISYEKRIASIFNFRDEITFEEQNLNDSNAMSTEIKDFMENDWINDLVAELNH